MPTLKKICLKGFITLALTAAIPLAIADSSAPQAPTAAQKAAHKAAVQAAIANVKSACAQDFQDRCSEFLPAEGQRPDRGFFSCVKQNEAVFSDGCQSAIQALKKIHHHHHHHHSADSSSSSASGASGGGQ
jgi:hypothetical protein